MISTAIDAKPTTLYRFYDAESALLYVGIATNPGRRFKQHADRQPWWPDVADIKVELYASTQDAHAAEFFLGSGVPRCPCQDMIGCEDCPDVRFPPDMAGELAWLDHVQTEHPEVFANAESPPHPEG